MKNKVIKSLPWFFMFLSLTLLGAVSVFASSEEELLNIIEKLSGSQVVKNWYDDFDMDGEKEVFAAVGTVEGYGSGDYGASLWFASSVEVARLTLENPWEYPDSFVYCNDSDICTINSSQKIFVIEYGVLGVDSLSFCAYVKDGIAIQVKNAGRMLCQRAGKEFYINDSNYDGFTGSSGDGSGHTYKRYYLEWTGEGFKEYVGTEMSREELERYDGAVDILSQAANEGYSIGTIWKRDNGIINVNLFEIAEVGRFNENLTLEYRDNSVNLEVINHGAKEWINRYSFHGEYEASASVLNRS